MDWSVVGREVKQVVKDVIDQSFGTHFFSSKSAQPTQSGAKSETGNNSDISSVQKPPEEVVNQTNSEEKGVQADVVRAELEQAIEAQRQKRLAEQEQVAQIRQDSLNKAGPQPVSESYSPTSSQSVNSPEKLDAKGIE